MRKMLALVAFSAISFAHGPSLAQAGPEPGGVDRMRPGVAGEVGSDSQGQHSEGQVEAEALTRDDFVYLAAMSILFDIEVAQLAAERAQEGAVRAFARRILADRRASLAGLRLSSAANNLPEALDEGNRRIVEALGEERGSDFDASFVGMMIDAMEDSLALYDEFIEATADDALVAFVAARADALRATLQEARQLESTLEAAGHGASR